jgi:peptidoglycan-N-acetylglucosamine deacetylase
MQSKFAIAVAVFSLAAFSLSAQAVKAAKLCALTFDDGPDAVKTARVLEKLEKYKVPATFFLVGQNIGPATKDVLARALKDGCEFGNHSWSYAGMNSMGPGDIEDSVDRTTAAIKQYTGTEPRFFRAPNLATSPAMFQVIKMPFVQGVIGVDWAGTNTDAQTRAANVMAGMRDGAIILLHDVQPDPHPTPEALDILIPALQEQGYEFVILSELFKRKGVDPASVPGSPWSYVQ